jgi:peptidoglycan/xylan/chitin deacetylase (PgdA/CDA1 family)
MMPDRCYPARFQSYYRRNIAHLLFKRPMMIHSPSPLISFTFDDFPRTAFSVGGAILHRHGLGGTYYASLGIMGTVGPSGPLFVLDDVTALLEQGHELGCHTFSHCHAWDTKPATFEASIIENRAVLKRLVPSAEFKSLSFPISEPRPITKQIGGRYFQCCRSGGQTLNAGKADLNQLSAFFLEQSHGRLEEVKALIDLNHEVRGWLIFATHDVFDTPSPYGCTPRFFESAVEYAQSSGARILPVAKALEGIRVPAS